MEEEKTGRWYKSGLGERKSAEWAPSLKPGMGGG